MKMINIYTFFTVFIFIFSFLFLKELQKVKKFEITSWTQDQTADCAVSLTGKAYRIEEGFNLLVQKQIKNLIISGVHKSSSLEEIFPAWPFYGSLDKKRVILDKVSKTTYSNAQQSLFLAKTIGCKSLIVITSHLHMYRAYKTFQAIFPSHIQLQSRSVVSGRLKPSIREFFTETFKSLFYNLWVY